MLPFAGQLRLEKVNFPPLASYVLRKCTWPNFGPYRFGKELMHIRAIEAFFSLIVKL